jgi:hypothetical protein
MPPLNMMKNEGWRDAVEASSLKSGRPRAYGSICSEEEESLSCTLARALYN